MGESSSGAGDHLRADKILLSSPDTEDEVDSNGYKIAEIHGGEKLICTVSGKVREENYYRGGHFMGDHELAMCEGCLDGRKT